MTTSVVCTKYDKNGPISLRLVMLWWIDLPMTDWAADGCYVARRKRLICQEGQMEIFLSISNRLTISLTKNGHLPRAAQPVSCCINTKPILITSLARFWELRVLDGGRARTLDISFLKPDPVLSILSTLYPLHFWDFYFSLGSFNINYL